MSAFRDFGLSFTLLEVTVFNDFPDLLPAFRRALPYALEVIYKRYYGCVQKTIRGGFGASGRRVAGVRDKATEEDLLQDSFLKAFGDRARLSYDPAYLYRPFLLRLVKNVVIDHLRKHSPRASPVDDQLEPEHEPPEQPEDDLDWRRHRLATLDFIAEQDEADRRFIQLRFVEELSQRQLAKKLDTTRAQVRAQETQLLNALLGYLRSRGTC